MNSSLVYTVSTNVNNIQIMNIFKLMFCYEIESRDPPKYFCAF